MLVVRKVYKIGQKTYFCKTIEDGQQCKKQGRHEHNRLCIHHAKASCGDKYTRIIQRFIIVLETVHHFLQLSSRLWHIERLLLPFVITKYFQTLAFKCTKRKTLIPRVSPEYMQDHPGAFQNCAVTMCATDTLYDLCICLLCNLQTNSTNHQSQAFQVSRCLFKTSIHFNCTCY